MADESPHAAVRALLESSSVLLSNHQLPEVLQGILDIAQRALAADAYAVWRQLEDGRWEIAASHGLSEEYAGKSAPIAGSGAPLREPLVLDDVRTHPLLQGRLKSFETEGIRAVAVIPIAVNDGRGATLSFYYRAPHRFGNEALEYACTVANLAGAAIANAELIRRQTDAAARFEVLARITSIFNSSLDFDRTAQSVADAVVPQLADWCALSLFENGQMRRIAVAHQDPAMIKVADEFGLKFPERLTAGSGALRVMQTGEAELHTGITDEVLAAAAQNAEHIDYLRKLDIRSVITVPLKLAGRTIGVLRLVSGGGRAALSKDDLQLAEEIAARAANALENARLHGEQLRLAQQLRKLNEIGRRLAAELDHQKLLQIITDAGTETTGAQFGAFFYIVDDDHHDKYMLYTLSGVDRSHFDKFPMPRKTQVFGPTFRGEGVVRSDDITQDPRYGKNEPYYGMPPGHLPVRSYLAVPVMANDGSVAGGLFFGHEKAGIFTEEMAGFVEAIASQATIALTNADLYNRAQQEIESRRAAEARLDRERSFLAMSQRVANVGSWELDLGADPVTAFWSPELIEMYGLIPGKFAGLYQTWIDSLHADDREEAVASLERAIEDHHPWHHEFRIVRPDGSIRWIAGRGQCFYDEEGKPRHMIGINMDVTERRATEAALLRSEKLSSAGRMAATIAHEINNPLEAITNLVFLARSGPADLAARMLEDADRELQRVAHITRQTLGFYREATAPREFDVAETTRQVMALLGGHLQRRATTVRLDVQPVRLEAVEGEIRQAISNLVVNAIDASPVGGEVHVRVRATWMGAGDGRVRGVRITIGDRGQGIPASQRPRIFEPFFTTKLDFGTGLGLWVVREIVQKHGGSIQLRSGPGKGTVVSLLLPQWQERGL